MVLTCTCSLPLLVLLLSQFSQINVAVKCTYLDIHVVFNTNENMTFRTVNEMANFAYQCYP